MRNGMGMPRSSSSELLTDFLLSPVSSLVDPASSHSQGQLNPSSGPRKSPNHLIKSGKTHKANKKDKGAPALRRIRNQDTHSSLSKRR
ncbi:hypothetical protein A4X09_0g543 [Tilletia walkeri]|uniref:Uncharacterized protein n=1 Tax=Tilletia walkeri TaxID=117179 RepID=A0A8X7T7H2_9BASI|nr:hypothetical protein A4X09_0g543 [Tilletia walkeri]